MEVEIWSDVMCPFCYIGKRRFENALKKFEHADQVNVIWRSFQLNPDMETDPATNTLEYMAKNKGWSLQQVRQMNQHLTTMAKNEGLEYNLDQAVIANSFDAHRLIQFAKERGKGDEMEEILFKAYFTDGKNIADPDTLATLAKQTGLDSKEVEYALQEEHYASNFKHDVELARNLNITGVPFFLFDRKFAVSGARETEVFLKALKQSWNAQLQKQTEQKA